MVIAWLNVLFSYAPNCINRPFWIANKKHCDLTSQCLIVNRVISPKTLFRLIFNHVQLNSPHKERPCDQFNFAVKAITNRTNQSCSTFTRHANYKHYSISFNTVSNNGRLGLLEPNKCLIDGFHRYQRPVNLWLF